MASLNRPPIDAAVQQDLLARARVAAENAYAPYSRFAVGAAALAADGSVYTGCNVENASLGLTICAERSALSAAVGAGHREIVAVAVSAPKAAWTTPCGACRQSLNEFRASAADLAVILDDGNSGHLVWLDELLPRAFGPQYLDATILNSDPGSPARRDDHGR